MKGLGIGSIGDIPADLSGLNVCNSGCETQSWTGAPTSAPACAAAWGRLRSPASFLDFETINPAIPLYIGTRPYERIPFQWSLHVLDGSGNLTHREFLNPDAEDPAGAVCVQPAGDAARRRLDSDLFFLRKDGD